VSVKNECGPGSWLIDRHGAKRSRPASGQSTAPPLKLQRIDALVDVAIEYISRGAPQATQASYTPSKLTPLRGFSNSVQYVAAEHAPYAAVLYREVSWPPVLQKPS